MNEAWKILFSTFIFQYDLMISMEEVNDILLKKRLLKHKRFSPLQYSIKIDGAGESFTVIRRGYLLAIIVTGTIDQELKKIKLEFKPIISPLFIVGPLLLFISKLMSVNIVVFVITMLGTILFAILFAYIPIKLEKKQLEREFQLIE